MTAQFTSNYGTREVGPMRQIDLGGWVRDDQWTSRYGNYTEASYLHAAGRDDVSNSHSMYPFGYDSRCGWCFLGAGHTDEAHDQKLATELARERRAEARGA